MLPNVFVAARHSGTTWARSRASRRTRGSRHSKGRWRTSRSHGLGLGLPGLTPGCTHGLQCVTASCTEDGGRFSHRYLAENPLGLTVGYNLTRRDLLVVSDVAAHYTARLDILQDIATSLVETTRAPGYSGPRPIWVDYNAPHFGAQESGEFRRDTKSCVKGHPPLGAPEPVHGRGHCTPHRCNAAGVGNLASMEVLRRGGIPVVHSFDANRRVHSAHPGHSWVNYSRWTFPDGHHPPRLLPSLPDQTAAHLPNAAGGSSPTATTSACRAAQRTSAAPSCTPRS